MDNEDIEAHKESWHLSKAVPISVIVILLVYLFSGVWSYSALMADVAHLKKSPSNTFGTTGILWRREREMADKIRKATGYCYG